MTFWQAWTKAQALTNGVQFSREEIQTWNQDFSSEDLYSEVEDDDQKQSIITTAVISTTESIEAFNKVIAWSKNNISNINDVLDFENAGTKHYTNTLKQKIYKLI